MACLERGLHGRDGDQIGRQVELHLRLEASHLGPELDEGVRRHRLQPVVQLLQDELLAVYDLFPSHLAGGSEELADDVITLVEAVVGGLVHLQEEEEGANDLRRHPRVLYCTLLDQLVHQVACGVEGGFSELQNRVALDEEVQDVRNLLLPLSSLYVCILCENFHLGLHVCPEAPQRLFRVVL